MAENPAVWPRIHTCLYNWCLLQHEECARCDAVLAAIQSASGGHVCAVQKGTEIIGSSDTKPG